jgi:hypothetical protein
MLQEKARETKREIDQQSNTADVFVWYIICPVTHLEFHAVANLKRTAMVSYFVCKLYLH